MPFSSGPQSYPAWGSCLMSQLFTSGGQSTGVSALASVLDEYSGLVSFRTYWSDHLGVQGNLKGLLQHCRSKESILQFSAFFMVQLSHLYMTTGKTILLIIKWQPIPVSLPGKSHGWKSLVGYSPWSFKESDMTERLHTQLSLSAK